MTATVIVQPWLACDAAAARLRGRPGLAWLDSSLVEGRLGRWSIVVSDPRWTLTGYEDGVLMECAGAPRRLGPGALHAFARLVEREQGAWRPAHAPDGLPFVGGAIGYLGFELGREVERVPATTRDDTGAPVIAFGWYDAALVWDGVAQRGWLVGRHEAVASLRARLEMAAGRETVAPPHGSVGLLRPNMTRAPTSTPSSVRGHTSPRGTSIRST